MTRERGEKASRLKPALFFGCALGLVLGAPQAAQAGEFGLAITSINYGPYDDPTDCPDGFALTPKETFLQALPEGQRKEFMDRDKRVGTLAAWVSRIASERRGPNGENACEVPGLIKDPPMRISQSKTSFGLDLDHGDTATHCGHQEFADPSGKQGIDNQVARLTACIRGLRNANNARAAVPAGDTSMVLRVTNVDDLQNDDDVTVDIYKSADTFIKDGSGQAVPDATLRGDKNAPVFHTSTRGKIVNGVLITAPVDAHIMPGDGRDWAFHGAQFQIRLQGDGAGEGILAGYFEMESFWQSWAHQYQQGLNIGFSCPALYESMHKLADGDKDPATGKCRSLSSAFHVKTVRTFILPPDGPAATVGEDVGPGLGGPLTELAHR